MGIESLKDWDLIHKAYEKYPWLNAPIYHAWKNKGVVADKFSKLGDKFVEKARELEQWEKDMGYQDGSRNLMAPTYDLLDKLGIIGTTGDAWNPETRGTGEPSGFLTQKLPAYWDASKDVAKEHGLSPLHAPAIMMGDARSQLGNLAKGVWDYTIKPIPPMAAEGWRYLQNKAIDYDRALAEKTGWDYPAARREKYPMQGWGAAGTWMQDTWAPVAETFGIPLGQTPTKLYEEGVNTVASNLYNVDGPYAPPRVEFKVVDGQVMLKNQTPKQEYENASGEEGWFPDTDLSNWGTYQYWKGGNWDNADDRRIQKRVNSRMEKMDFSPDEMYPLFLAEAQMPGREHYLDDKMYYYKEFVKRSKNDVRNNMMNRFEFEETGKDYAKWASDQYQGNMIKKYGKYPLFEEGIALDENQTLSQLESLSQNLSPFEGLTSNFELANEDYMKALRKGKKPANIGEPTEWDYGMFDTKEGVGLSEPDWMKYSSDEAKEFWHSPQMTAIELGGLFALRAPLALRKPAQHWLQTTGLGRTLREIAPGLLQHGPRYWGGAQRFGIPTIPKMFEGNKAANWMWNYPSMIPNAAIRAINFARPKGLQAAAIIERSEQLGPFDRGAYEYE